MSGREVLEGLIDQLKDYIDDYRETHLHSKSRIEQYEYRIRKEELIRWKRIAEELLMELEEE